MSYLGEAEEVYLLPELRYLDHLVEATTVGICTAESKATELGAPSVRDLTEGRKEKYSGFSLLSISD